MDKHRETQMALKIRSITGKKLRTCYFCVRYHNGNYSRALSMCAGETAEGDRLRQAT